MTSIITNSFHSLVNATVLSQNQLVNFFSKIVMYEFAKIALFKVRDFATPYFKEIINKTFEKPILITPPPYSCSQCDMMHKYHSKEKIEAIAKETITEKKTTENLSGL